MKEELNQDNSSLDSLLVQVSEMIQMIQNHKGPISGNITPRVLEELELLEKTVVYFNDVNQQAFKDSHIDMERLEKETMHSPTISSKDKQLLLRAKDIERDARNLQLAFSKAIERGKRGQKGKMTTKAPSRQKIKERRKLFKPLGGDKNWIPL